MENNQLKTILLVDDDPIFLKGIMYTVKSLGYQTLMASNGREAAGMLKDNKVDVVISDINMPDGNGLQLLNYVIKNSKIPVILMTGLSDLKEAQKAIEMGARNFISKPFKKIEIAEAISSCFELRPKTDSVDEMVRIHLEEFLHGEDLKYPVYIMKDDLLVKVSNGGETISPDMIAGQREIGINFLYLKKSDFVQYVGILGGELINKDDHREVVTKSGEYLETLTLVKRMNPKAFERASMQFESTLEVLLSSSETSQILKARFEDKDSFKKSIRIGLLASLIGQYLGHVKTRHLFCLIAAGLFHKDEVQKMSFMVLEDERNLGKIYSLALKAAEEFDELGINVDNISRIVSGFIVDSLGKFDLKALEALSMVFNISTPEEFVNYQLEELLNVKAAI